MPKVALYNIKGDQVGELDLSDAIFGIEINEAVLHDAVVMQQANQRFGNSSTKTRAEVSGGGKKPWRQKGTGRARAGSSRSPIWKGGGITFGPKPRSYAYSLPKKVRRLALKSALSQKVQNGNLVVLESLTFEDPKTKDMAEILKNLKVNKALVVTADNNENIEKSARNIAGIKPLNVTGINVLDLLFHEKVVITKDAITKVEEVLA